MKKQVPTKKNRLIKQSSFIGLTFVAALTLLAGCGGGGGGGGSTATPAPTPTPTPPAGPTLSGTVAKGAALAGYQVTVVSIPSMQVNWPNGHSGQIGSATTDNEGHYSVSLERMPSPYLILAVKSWESSDENYPRLFSVALDAGTANVTPLTDLLTTQLFGKSFNDIFNSAIDYSALVTLSQGQIDNARQAVVDYLLHRPSKYQQMMTMPVDASPVGDFISASFQLTANDSYNATLDNLQDTLVDGENIYALEMHMMDRAIAATDVAAIAPTSLHCDMNICGTSSAPDYRTVAPYYSKYALLKALYLEFDRHGVVQLNCGNAPTIAGLHAGVNSFYLDDTVLRINDLSANSGAFSLLSATALELGTSAPTIGVDNFVSYANVRSEIKAHQFRVDIRLNETAVTAMEFRLNGSDNPITCVP